MGRVAIRRQSAARVGIMRTDAHGSPALRTHHCYHRVAAAIPGSPYLLRRPKLRRSCARDGQRSEQGFAVLFQQARRCGGRQRARGCRFRRAPPNCIMKLNWWSRCMSAAPMSASTEAASLIFGYAVGIDLTRRDLQAEAKKSGRPWDMAKGFDHSAPIGPLRLGIPPAVGLDLFEHRWRDAPERRSQGHDLERRGNYRGAFQLCGARARRFDIYRHARRCRPDQAR